MSLGLQQQRDLADRAAMREKARAETKRRVLARCASDRELTNAELERLFHVSGATIGQWRRDAKLERIAVPIASKGRSR